MPNTSGLTANKIVGLLARPLFFFIIGCWFGVTAVLADDSKHGQRFALVIGNGDYRNISELRNAVNDAELMSKTLNELGFSVTLLKNMHGDQMLNAIMDFGDMLINSRSGEAVLFFYSGHGIRFQGQSILLPVDYDPEKSVPNSYLTLQQVLVEFQGITQKTKIFIIDACREDAALGENRLTSKDISNYQIPSGGMLAFSTGPADLAQDGSGRNSPYTDALTIAMVQPGLELSAVFRKTREAVISRTKGLQSPTETSMAVGEFFFLPGKHSNQVVDFGKEGRSHWLRIKDSQSPLDFFDYLDRFPDGEFADMARERYRNLQAFAQPSEKGVRESKFGVKLVYNVLPNSNAPVLKVAEINTGSELSGKLLKGDLILQINHNPLPIGKDPNKLLDEAFSKARRLDLLVKRGESVYTLSWHE